MNAIAVAGTEPAIRRPGSGRILAAFRIHYANPAQTVWMPLMIIGIVFVLNWLIWLVVHLSSTDGTAGMSQGTLWSGASSFMFVWLIVLASQSMNRTFHFALGLGATRRDYYLGTTLALLAFCVGWAVLFGALGLLEDATGGWGLGGHMFSVYYFGDDGPVARTWYAFCLMVCFAGIGLVSGALFVRWRTWGLIGFFAVLALLLIGGAAIIALTGTAAAVWSFLAGTLGFAGTFPLLLIPAAIAVPIGYLALRRATARS